MSNTTSSVFDQDNIGQFIELNGVNIHYYEEGLGEPVLFIHGIGQSMYTFRNNIPDFAACFRVIAVDLIGHGQTDAPEIDYAIEDYSDMLLSFLDAMHIESTNIFAFSTGGIIAIDFAVNFPDRVRKLIMVSPGGLTEHYPALIKHLTAPILGDILFTFFNKESIRKCLQEAYFDRTNVNDKLVDHYARYLLKKEYLDAVVTTLNNWDDSHLADMLHTLTIPIFIFWGECDYWHPLSYLELYEEAIKQLYSATVRNGGHLVHEEKYREINRKSIELLLSDE